MCSCAVKKIRVVTHKSESVLTTLKVVLQKPIIISEVFL
jgi:hypothetical protein